MPRTNRNLLKRTVLQRTVLRTFHFWIFLLIFFSIGVRAGAAAVGADSNPFAAPAREFARRIANSFPGTTRVAVEVRNHSALSATDVAAVRAALLDELTLRSLRVASAAGDSADVGASATITLSENAEGFLWVAEIRQADHNSVMLMAVPPPSEAPAAQASGITLRGALVWSGPEHVLAAALMPATLQSTASAAGAPNVSASSISDVAPNLLLLVTDGVSASVIDAQRTLKIALPSSGDVDRDAQGMLAWNGSSFTAKAFGESCAFFAPLAGQQPQPPQCHAEDAPHSPPVPALAAQIGSQRADIPAACGEASGEILAAGTGDYTQPDSIRAYEMRSGAAAPVSPALEFPGPVMSLQAVTSSQTVAASQAQPAPPALAVVRNLASGDDEVYEISLVCGH
jgi:hypothetical protein